MSEKDISEAKKVVEKSVDADYWDIEYFLGTPNDPFIDFSSYPREA